VTVFNPAPGGGASGSSAFTINAPNPVPTISSLVPASATAGGATFTLTVNGTGFVSGSVVNWNGTSRTTTFVSATQLQAAITAADIATVGTGQVTVFNPAPGGGASGSSAFTINAPNPVPTISSLSPASATAGTAAFTLTVNGTGFLAGSILNWNGTSRTTTFISATQVKAAIAAADIAAAGTAQVTVFNPAPGGGASGSSAFTINAANPVPTISSLSPASATAGTGAFTLTVNGTGFLAGSVVNWNGTSRTTTFVSATQLQAAIAAADIATTGTGQVTVFNPTPGGGTSGSSAFTINAPNPVPTISSLSPASATAGAAAFTLTVNGTGFLAGSVVNWNGTSRTTTFVSATQVKAAITAADIAAAGTAQLTVFNPAPGGGTSGASPFTINASNPVPTISSLSPASATVGTAAFTLTVNGTGFVNGSVVRWSGSNRTTTFVSATQLQAAIKAADISKTGTKQVTVFNPTPGGGTSWNVAFTITATNPVPTITSLSPASATAGTAAFTLTVNGTGYLAGSVVNWNGTSRTTTFVSATQLQAAITAADIAAAGTGQVTVFNPAPGGGTSGSSAFTINAPNPVPTISSLSPASATAGTAAFNLTVNGTGFIAGSVVNWNGTSRTTTYVSATQVKAAITSTDIATAGTAQVTVFNPAPGGGTSGNAAFTITAANPVPTISSLAPTSATAGTTAFTLTVNGTGFVLGSVVNWNGTSRMTTFVNATQLQAAITAADIAVAGTAQVAVFNPAPGGGTSGTSAFTISPSTAPILTNFTCSPASITSGSNSSCTVTLDHAAPSGGTSIALKTWGQINLVHVTSCGSGAFPTTTCTIPATGSGNLIVVAWSSVYLTTPTISTIIDNVGNTYSQAGNARSFDGTNGMVDIWYAKNSKAGAGTLTITPSPSGNSGAAVIWEFSNVDTAAPLDQTAVLNTQSASAAPFGAAVTTTAPAEAVVSVMVPGGSMIGLHIGNSFTNDFKFYGNGWAHLITSSAGTYSGQWDITGTYASSTVSFKAGNSTTLNTPTSITVPAGFTSATFQATAQNVPSSQNVIVTATLNGASRNFTLNLAPSATGLMMTANATFLPAGTNSVTTNHDSTSGLHSAVSALSCTPKTLSAHALATCDVRVTATPKPVQLHLTSSSSYVKIPAAVTARANQSRLTFQVSVDSVDKDQTVNLTATLGDTTVQDAIVVASSLLPNLEVPGKQFVKTGTPLRFQVRATDATQLPVQLTATDVPSGAVFDPLSGTFEWTPDISQTGKYHVQLTATNVSGQSSKAQVTIDVDSGRPVVSGASDLACSPGAIGTLNGKWLVESGDLFSDPSGNALELGGTKVKINDHSVRLIAASREQLRFLCPALDQGEQLSMMVETAAGASEPVKSTMHAASPEIFSLDGTGQNQGVITFADMSTLAADRNFRVPAYPAQPGDEVVIWGTGFGSAAEARGGTTRVEFGGIDAEVVSVRAVPGHAGVYIVQARVPAPIALGAAVPVQVQVHTQDGKRFNSNKVTVVVEPVSH
jgi:uncharacterized protein (TIGR03437 family)